MQWGSLFFLTSKIVIVFRNRNRGIKMINVVQNNDKYQISFSYDPGIVYLVKGVPGRRWNPDEKYWSIPIDKLGFFLDLVKGTKYESIVKIVSDEDLGVNETLDSTTSIPDVDMTSIPFYVQNDSKPYQHQLDFMKWAIDRERGGNMSGFLLTDEMGLGKTLQILNLAEYNKRTYGYKHCLIVCCVNSAKYNWLNDVRNHLSKIDDAYILGSRLRKNKSVRYDAGSKAKLDDLKSGHMYGDKKYDKLPYFLIVNIETFRYKVGRNYVFTDEVIKQILANNINMIAIDEVHKNVSPSSKQGQQLFRIKKATNRAAMWIPLTGTPITSKPTDVFLPLKLVDGHNFSSFYKWCNEFCVYGGYGGYEIIGYKNIPKLKQMLQYNMIRRLKSDVLDLPPKIRCTEYVDNTLYQHKLYDKVLQNIINSKDEILTSLNPMTKFLRLRQVNGSPELVDLSISTDDPDYLKKNAKLQRLLELIDDNVARGEKTVVFSNWVEPLKTLYKFISEKYKTCVFTGTMTTEAREHHKEVFMKNPEYKVLIGTVGAAGTSQTFTVAKNLIFYDEPWNPSDKEQAEDRIYRIGTKEPVTITTLIAKDTVDDKVNQILSTKDGIAKYIVDNKLDLKKNPDLFDILLDIN